MKTPHPADATLREGPEFPFGSGKGAGVLSVVCGWLGLGGVVALHFPEFLATPGARAAYPMGLIRGLLASVILAALLFGLGSIVLGRRKSRGMLGLSLGGLALALGGWWVSVPPELPEGPVLGLDWFLLSLFATALLFVPLERAFRRVQQRIFRPGWRTDLAHYGVSHLLVQVTVLLTMLPATLFLHGVVPAAFQQRVAGQPLWLQFIEALIVADLFAYGAHRLFHEVPLLWRFHQIHHSAEHMDWLAGSRLHLVDIVLTRAFAFIPLYALGFSQAALGIYAAWAAFQATLNHANVRWTFGPLRFLLVTPQFHHWHHSADVYDKNFAVHLPVIDRLFGTWHLPGNEWPARYGLDGSPVPDGYVKQAVYPFKKTGDEGMK